jgi:hypothetical protein
LDVFTGCIFHESLQTMSFRTRIFVLHLPSTHNAASFLSFIHSILTVSSDRCSFFIGLYSFYAFCTAKLLQEKKTALFPAKSAILFHLYFLTLKMSFFFRHATFRATRKSITSLQNNSITLRRSCNVVVTSLYKNSPVVNNCK